MKTCNHCGAELPITTLSAEGLGLPGQYCGTACVLGEALIRITQKQEGQRAGWISVTERLPQVHERVLAFCPEALSISPASVIVWGHVQTDGAWQWVMQGGTWLDKYDMSHWQPLPEPPPVEQKREAGRCDGCKNWFQFVGEDSLYGGCALAHLARQHAEGWIHTDSVLATRADFGCVAFQAKGEA